ncbi:hypothetical protein [Nesterenkonia pannonica]|uniref:hypothetical protein n=1 Tax=Nesterenkonia pannonica TaxID=1548602 RepID=UPI002164230A|nr:hypothetical protein [Nesterenkonia pannonica]
MVAPGSHGDAASLTGGEIAGRIAMLAAPEDGGPLKAAAAAMDDIALELAYRVNGAQGAGSQWRAAAVRTSSQWMLPILQHR